MKKIILILLMIFILPTFVQGASVKEMEEKAQREREFRDSSSFSFLMMVLKVKRKDLGFEPRTGMTIKFIEENPQLQAKNILKDYFQKMNLTDEQINYFIKTDTEILKNKFKERNDPFPYDYKLYSRDEAASNKYLYVAATTVLPLVFFFLIVFFYNKNKKQTNSTFSANQKADENSKPDKNEQMPDNDLAPESNEQMPSAFPQQQLDILERLSELKEKRIITEEEFNKKKADILDKL